jgi:hypothetical protein
MQWGSRDGLPIYAFVGLFLRPGVVAYSAVCHWKTQGTQE